MTTGLSRRPRTSEGHTPRPPHLLAIVENVPFGVDTRLRKQVGSLLAHGYRVTVISRRDRSNRPYRAMAGLRLLEYDGPREAADRFGYIVEYAGSLFASAWRCLRVRLRERIDVVQLCQPPDLYFPLAMVLRVLGCTILVDQRDLTPELYAARFHAPGRIMRRIFSTLTWLSHRSADTVVCVNGSLERSALETGASVQQVAIVRNGPVLSRIDRARADPSLKRGAAYLCCWVGKMGRQDRLDLLVEVTDRLVHQLGRTDWHLVILGDGECLDETRAAVARLDLEPWVTFTGWVPEDVVFTHLATSDIGLDSSLQEEVSPVKVVEYMAAGLPVAAFDLPETRALAAGAASLAPAGDVEALARAVDELLDHPELRIRLGRRGRERVANELAWEHQAGVYLETVERMTRRDQSGQP